MRKRWLACVVIVAACSKKESAPKPEPAEPAEAAKPAEAVKPEPPPEPPKPAALELPKVDTSTWKPIKVSKLGKHKFGFDGTLLVPPKSKTETTETFYSDHKRAGLMAYVTLPDGVKVMLGERTAVSQKDPAMLKQILESTGTIVLDRHDANSYMIVLKRDDGLVVAGAMWPVEPGLDCATEQPLTLDQLAETIALCDSFAK